MFNADLFACQQEDRVFGSPTLEQTKYPHIVQSPLLKTTHPPHPGASLAG